MSETKAKLSVGSQEFELPVLSGSMGPDVIDIASLTPNGYFTYDPGFVSTASCESKITFMQSTNALI